MVTITLKKILGFDENDIEITEVKTYTAPRANARMIRNATVLAETLDVNSLTTADLDLAVNFTVELFMGKITADDIWDGIYADKLMETLMGCINGVLAELHKTVNKLPNAVAE